MLDLSAPTPVLAPDLLASLALVLGYALAVALTHRTGWFDLTFHLLVLLLIGLSLGPDSPARALATALLVTILAATVLGVLLGTGQRSPAEHARRPLANRTATLRRPSGPPKPSVAP